MTEAATAPHRCKYCGAPSWVDPSDQDAPSDYCHEQDHGYPPTDIDDYEF